MDDNAHIPQPRHSTPMKKSYGNSGYHSGSSPVPQHNSASTSGIMSMADLESTTVEKQRKELQLLIGELKDRDRELNDMVAAHQQQLSAWERDRQRGLLLEKKNEKYEAELKKRQEQIRLLIQRLKVSESKHKGKDSALETAQSRLKQLEKNMSTTSYEVENLKEKNVSLNTSLTDMSSKFNTMESREQELMTLLRLKEKEVLDMTGHVSTLSSKLRYLDAELQDSKRSESRSRTDIQDERTRYKQTRNELDSLKAEMVEKTNEILMYRKEISQLKEEIHAMQKEIYLKDDELRRKDDLIRLQKSRQDRADKELTALRLVYENQQKELTALHISLSDSQDMLEKQEERINQISQNGLDLSDFEDSCSDATNDLLEEARRSATSNVIISDMDGPDPKQQIYSQSSPTSKLQKLLAESREMVHNLERTALTPVPRPNSARASTSPTSY